MSRWFKIDNAGKIFPVITEAKRSSYFRLAVELEDIVDPILLQKAAEATLKRFPNFKTRLNRGLFWNFLETQSLPFKVLPEPNTFGSISQPFNRHKHLVEVFYHRHRIAIEIFHSVTDGRGGSEFLKTLTLAYLRLKNYPVSGDGIIFDAEDVTSDNELEDSFLKRLHRGPSKREPTPLAYHLKGTYFPHNGHYLTHVELSTSAFIQQARLHQTTLTGLLTSIIIYTLLNQQKEERPLIKHPIRVSVPIDMRKYVASTTMRNFVMTVNVGGDYPYNTDLKTIIEDVREQLKKGQDFETLLPQIRANLSVERLWIIRFIPNFLKQLLIKSVFNKVGESAFSFTLSNLGPMQVPDTLQPYVKRFEFMVCSTPVVPINVGVVSYQDKLVLSFSRIITNRSIIQQIVEYITRILNVPVVVYGNRWEEDA